MRVIPSLALLAISSVTLFKLPAVADTYQILALANDDLVSEIYGIDDNKVVLEAPDGAVFCGPDSTGTCYLTFVNGIDVSNSVIPPLLSPNMGGPMGPGCAPLPVDAVVSAYLCVNGHEAYIGAFPAPPGQSRGPNGIFNGPDPVTNLVFGGIPFPNQQFLAENSFGDIVWDDTISENAFEAVDLTSHEAPEPGTVLLVGTGLLAIGSIRRRLFR
jgi:hypothetical protein